MTAPSLTYGHGYLTDCDDATSWTEARNNMLDADAELSVLYHDIFQIKAVFDEGAGVDEYCNYEYDLNPNISSNTYTKFLLRYKTSEGSAGAQAKAVIIFTAGDQTILEPSYNTTWAVVDGDITSGKTIDKVQFWADDDGTDGTFYVYFDFLLLHEGTFTFPQFTNVYPLHLANQYVKLRPYGRVGDIKHYAGMDSPTIRLEGPMDTNIAWGTPDGEYLYRIFHEAHTDPWQWFTSDLINCKMVPEVFDIGQQAASGNQRMWMLNLGKYDKSSGSETTWSDLQWLGI